MGRFRILVTGLVVAFLPAWGKAAEVLPIYELVFPPITVDSPQESFEKLTFTVACGRVDSIIRVPELWHIEIGRDSPAEGTFSAETTLGGAALPSTRELDRAIRIRPLSGDCVAHMWLTGEIWIRGQPYRVFKLSNENLRKLPKRETK